MQAHHVVGLDIGTAAVKAVVVERRQNRLVPKLFVKEVSRGMRRGAICDFGDAGPVIANVVAQIKQFSKNAARSIYASVGTSQIKTQHSRGIVAVSRADSEINSDDVERVVKAAQAINVGPNRMIIHNITREFIVDGVPDITDPLGLVGSRLEVNSLVIDAFLPHINLAKRAVEAAGGEIIEPVFGPLAASRAALSKHQKDLGVLLMDIGAGTTGISVWEENKLVGTAKFPVGASNISNDIAICLKIPVETAEQIKLNFGYAISKEVAQKESIDLKRFYPEARGPVSRRFVADIIESRLSEIFEFVTNEVKLMGKWGKLAGGVVIAGGGAKLPGLTELTKQELKLSSQIGIPIVDRWEIEDGQTAQYFEDPEFITALGLALWGVDKSEEPRYAGISSAGLKNIFRYFIP